MKKGFSLIELLIYISCLIFLSIAFISFLNFYINIKNNLFLSRSRLEIIIAFNLIINDIKLLSFSEFDYFKDGNNIIFKVNNDYFSWVVKAGKLYKYIGKYSVKNKSWIKKRANLLSQNINYLKIEINSVKYDNLVIDIIICDFKNKIYNSSIFIKYKNL